MRFSHRQGVLEAKRWARIEDLENRIRAHKRGLLVGLRTEHSLHGSFEYSAHKEPEYGFMLGVCYSTGRLDPELLIMENDQTVLVGFDSEIVALSLPELTNMFRLVLGTSFVAFCELESLGILIVEEIGVRLITSSGNTVWSYSNDVIVDYKFVDGTLHLHFMDSVPAQIDLLTGQQLV